MNSNCPCPLECERHGDCVACRKFHELLGKGQAGPAMGVNLMDYAACAG